MKKLKHLVPALLIGGIVLSCSSSQQSTSTDANQPRTTEHYTSSFPQKDVSRQLQRIHKSVLRIVTTGFYNNYSFEKRYITLNDIKTNDLDDIASGVYNSEGSTAGTSIILDHRSDKSLLLTCEHIVSFPDTLIKYYKGDDIPENTFVKSISIKRDQSNIAYTEPELESFDVLATNPRSDLALLRVDHATDEDLNIEPLPIISGDSERMQLGSFLYIMGFPKGYPMITRGVTSTTDDWKERFFITDALFNPGISGGLIIATRNNFRSFQWVGVASSATANREDVLVPRPISEQYSKATLPYQDSVFVQQKTRINYGITQAVKIDEVKKFLSEQEQQIIREGFDLRASRFSQ